MSKGKRPDGGISNKDFMENDLFKKCCEMAGIAVTKRQAAKFRRGEGSAFKKRKEELNNAASTN